MGAYLSIIAGAIKLFNYLAAALQQHHDEMNGVTAQEEATREATDKVLETVSNPISDAERDKLWDQNAAKFGPDSKSPG